MRVGGFVSDLLYGIEGDVVHSGAGASDVESLEMLAYMVNRERFVVHYKRTDAQAAVVAKARMEIK